MFKDRASASAGTGHERKAEHAMHSVRRHGPTFREVATEWWALVAAGKYARRRGRSKQLSQTTIADYRGILFGRPKWASEAEKTDVVSLMARCGARAITELDDAYWQSLIDELVVRGLSYSRIASYLAVIRHIYAYATRANRRVVPADPTRELAMPANDGKSRERVARGRRRTSWSRLCQRSRRPPCSAGTRCRQSVAPKKARSR